MDRMGTNYGVSSTVAAAVFLMSEARPTHEVMAKLAAGEFEQVVTSVKEIAGKLTPVELADVTRLVGRCPSCYPPGTLDALKLRRLKPAPQPPSVSRSNGPTSRRPGRIIAKSLHGRAHTRGFEHAQSSAASAMPTYGTRNGVTPTMGIAATTAEPVSASTLRVRRHRQRRRDGVRLFTVEVPERLIEQAITRGLLKQEDRAKPWPHCDRCGARSPSRSRLSWCRRASAGVLPAVQ